MGVRTWLLGVIGLVVVATEIVLLTRALQFVDTVAWNHVATIQIMAAISAYPYLVVFSLSAGIFRHYSCSQWWLLFGMLVIMAATLFYRYAEFWMAQEAFEANLHGMKYMNCALRPVS